MFQTINNMLPILCSKDEYLPAKMELNRLQELEAVQFWKSIDQHLRQLNNMHLNYENYCKQIIRRQCIERYKRKRKLGQSIQYYQVRKDIAEKRLRINGQFLTQYEQEKILSAKKILGTQTIQIRKNNVKIRINGEKKKEDLINQIEKLMPKEIIQKVKNKKRIFKIV